MNTTNVCKSQSKVSKCEILSKSRKTPDIYILYNLFQVERFEQIFYGIEVVEMVSGDRVAKVVGDNLDKTKELFELLWSNYVTPCTVADIIEDMDLPECI